MKVDRKALVLQSECTILAKALRTGSPKATFEAMKVVERLREAFKAYEPSKVAQAEAEYHKDGEIEIDEGAVCSRGEDSGCYVQAWVWVYD